MQLFISCYKTTMQRVRRVYATFNNVPVGFADVSICARKTGYVHYAYVFPLWRRKGYLTRVLRATENWAEKNKLHTLRCVTYTTPYDNEYVPSFLMRHAFHRKHEFHTAVHDVSCFEKKCSY